MKTFGPRELGISGGTWNSAMGRDIPGETVGREEIWNLAEARAKREKWERKVDLSIANLEKGVNIEESHGFLVKAALETEKRRGADSKWKENRVFVLAGGLLRRQMMNDAKGRILALLGEIGVTGSRETAHKIIAFCTDNLSWDREVLQKTADIAKERGDAPLLVRVCMRRRDENERSSESGWEFVKNGEASRALVSMGLEAVPAIVEEMKTCGAMLGFSEILDGAIMKDSSAKSVPQMCRMLRRHMQEGRNAKEADRTAFCALADRLMGIHGEAGEALEPADARNIQKCIVELCKRTGFYKAAAGEFGKLLQENGPVKRGRKFRKSWQKNDPWTMKPRRRPLGWALPQGIKRRLFSNDSGKREVAERKIKGIIKTGRTGKRRG